MTANPGGLWTPPISRWVVMPGPGAPPEIIEAAALRFDGGALVFTGQDGEIVRGIGSRGWISVSPLPEDD